MPSIIKTVWHGTDAEPFEQFDPARFRNEKFGFWFATQRDFVGVFGNNLAEVEITLDNPYSVSTPAWNRIRELHARDERWFAGWRQRILAAGHDGLHVRPDSFTSSRGVVFEDPEVFAVFDAARIRILRWDAVPAPAAPGPR